MEKISIEINDIIQENLRLNKFIQNVADHFAKSYEKELSAKSAEIEYLWIKVKDLEEEIYHLRRELKENFLPKSEEL